MYKIFGFMGERYIKRNLMIKINLDGIYLLVTQTWHLQNLTHLDCNSVYEKENYLVTGHHLVPLRRFIMMFNNMRH